MPDGCRGHSREALRRFFEVDAGHVVVAVLSALAEAGAVERSVVAEAIAHHDIDPDTPDPGRHDTVPATGQGVGRSDTGG